MSEERRKVETYKDLVDALQSLFNDLDDDEMTDEEVDAYLREMGYDPDEVAERMQAYIKRLIDRSNHPSEPGSYKQARGVFNWQEGDEPAEKSIRRIRDGDE